MEMECGNCARSIKIGDGLKCSECESRYHTSCVPGEALAAERRHAGDVRRGGVWRCSSCTHPAAAADDDASNIAKLVVSVNEKIDLINKIQLPRLSSELLQLKKLADVMVKQNLEMLRKLKTRERHQQAASPSLSPPPRLARRRYLTATKKRNPVARIAAYFLANKKRRQ